MSLLPRRRAHCWVLIGTVFLVKWGAGAGRLQIHHRNKFRETTEIFRGGPEPYLGYAYTPKVSACRSEIQALLGLVYFSLASGAVLLRQGGRTPGVEVACLLNMCLKGVWGPCY